MKENREYKLGQRSMDYLRQLEFLRFKIDEAEAAELFRSKFGFPIDLPPKGGAAQR